MGPDAGITSSIGTQATQFEVYRDTIAISVDDTLPHQPILSEAAAAVIHCGHGSTMRTLLAGVPMVCVPLGREQYEPCYHLGCDDIGNPSLQALDEMGDAAAHAVISLAQSTQAVNGERGKGNFNTPPGQQHDIPEPTALVGD